MELENNMRYQAEESKSVIYDTKTNKDICMYFGDENRDFLLKILNDYIDIVEAKQVETNIISCLKQNTEKVFQYVGGGEEPYNIAFKHSKNVDIDKFLLNITLKIMMVL